MKSETAYIVHPVLPQKSARSTDAQLEEGRGLTEAIDLNIVGVKIAKVSRISPGHFIGKGNRELIAQEIETLKPNVVIFNHALSPIQQRNLEKDWNVKVIDRTGLILEIFAARAQTKEGRLQVEMAVLEYQRSRLVKLWPHEADPVNNQKVEIETDKNRLINIQPLSAKSEIES